MALTRKRSATSTPPGTPTKGPTELSLKRNRSYNESDLLHVIPRDEAWHFDTNSLLPKEARDDSVSPLTAGNIRNYDPSRSIFVLCLQGSLNIHCHLLGAALPELCSISPNIQAIILRPDSATMPAEQSSASIFSSASSSLPSINGVTSSYNHFLQLGLLHPLGGGQQPLDSIVVIDTVGLRRLVLPFGWGAGKFVLDKAGGKIIQDNLMESLRRALSELVLEQQQINL